MKQTAVEWLVNELLYLDNEFDMKLIDKNEYQARRKKVTEQAKAMEEEQLIMFGAQCMVEVEKESGLGAIKIYELCFDKTFKSE